LSELIKWEPTTSPEIIEKEAKELAKSINTPEDCEKALALVKALLKHPHFKKDKEAQAALKKAALWLERRAGELLAEAKENKERQSAGGDRKSKYKNDILIPTLSQINIDPIKSSKWQQIASIPQEQFEETISRKPAVAPLLRIAKELKVKSWEHEPAIELGDIRTMEKLPCGSVDIILTEEMLKIIASDKQANRSFLRL